VLVHNYMFKTPGIKKPLKNNIAHRFVLPAPSLWITEMRGRLAGLPSPNFEMVSGLLQRSYILATICLMKPHPLFCAVPRSPAPARC
jgi:hypothetical protein